MTSLRPLTKGQRRALTLLGLDLVSTSTARRMPSLHRRGLAEPYWTVEGGRRYKHWRITDLGRKEVEAEREAEREPVAQSP